MKRACLSLVVFFVIIHCLASETTNDSIQFQCSDTIVLDLSTFVQVVPVKGKVISPFGYRGGRKHTGADIKLHKGDTVRAAFCGLVTKADSYYGYGKLVILEHTNAIETYYSHLNDCLVKEGDSILAGEAIGLGGRTGRATTDHLHFEVRHNKKPCDPEKYFNFNDSTLHAPFIEYRTIVQTKQEEIREADNSEASVIIQKGDTLYSLAKRHGTTVKQLQELNHLEGTLLSIGMTLKVR